MLDRLSTRSRIIWLVVASALPVIVLSVYVALEQRASAATRAREAIQQHAELFAALVDVMGVDELSLLPALGLGREETVVILDREANVTARYAATPGSSGEGLPDRAVLDALSAGAAVFERRDRAGVVRLWTVKRAAVNPERGTQATVLVSIPRSVIHEESHHALAVSLLGIAAVTLLLIVFAWYGAERLVLRPIRGLLEMASRVRSGDLSARSGMTHSREELSQLGAALDDMAEQIEARDAKLRSVLEELRTQAISDALTGLYNRRYFWDALTRELIAEQREPTDLSVVLIDLDHFKEVNDTWGHDAGDRVLQEVADLLRASVRGSDIAVRYGGEEFAVLLPGTPAQVAAERAEEMRRELEARTVDYGSASIRITASFGVADYSAGNLSPAAFMRRVDAALYSAKQSGRNKVVVHRPEGPDPEPAGCGLVGTAHSAATKPAPAAPPGVPQRTDSVSD